MSLVDDIPEGALGALDTVVWIYEVEANPRFGPLVRPFFRDRLGTGRNRAGSSLLTLGELLVQPLSLGRTDLVTQYRSFFSTGPTFSVWDLTRQVVEEAAALRVRYRLKMMDALHVASAIVNGASLFLSNDEGLRRVSEVRVLILADYAATGSP